MISYRDMTNFDLPEVLAIEKSAYLKDAWTINQFKEELSAIASSRKYLVASEGGIIGYGGAAIAGEVVDIHTLTVREDYRRRGIGGELLKRLEAWSAERGIRKVMLEVAVTNEAAIKLYEAAGYQQIRVRPNYYGAGLDAYVMERCLDEL
ncbi:MAG: hypothetical protein RLZZ99_537 [Actinomycetota bacterium]